MKTGIAFVSAVGTLLLSFVPGCATVTTVTVDRIIPPSTITLPAVTTTLPAVTRTLPGRVTTIPATTVTIEATVTTVPPMTLSQPDVLAVRFLPSIPETIKSHADETDIIDMICLTCHGPERINQFPLPPLWDATAYGSQIYSGVYNVAPGSIQDHTGLHAYDCLGCHPVYKQA